MHYSVRRLKSSKYNQFDPRKQVRVNDKYQNNDFP